MNFLEEAKRLWPTANILGHGRYAVSGQNGAVVYLALTEQQAHNIGLGIENPQYEDLAPKPQAKIRERAHDLGDADDRRRARDEARKEEAEAWERKLGVSGI